MGLRACVWVSLAGRGSEVVPWIGYVDGTCAAVQDHSHT